MTTTEPLSHTPISRSKKNRNSPPRIRRKYRLFFQNNPLPIFIIDDETHHILEINESAIRLYGYCREEFLKMSLLDLVYSEDLPKIERIISETVPNQLSVRHKKKNGEIIDLEIIRHKFHYDGRPARFAIIQDFTERKRAERLIKEKNLLLEQTYDAIFIWNIDDGIIN